MKKSNEYLAELTEAIRLAGGTQELLGALVDRSQKAVAHWKREGYVTHGTALRIEPRLPEIRAKILDDKAPQ